MLKKFLKRAIQSTGYDLIKYRGRAPYNQDGLSTWHNSSFTNDDRFTAAYARGISGTPDQTWHPGPWRAHVAIWAAQTALRHNGDFIECGVYLGFVTSVILTHIDWNRVCGDRRFMLVDSYEGLSKDQLTAAELAIGRDSQYGDDYVDTYSRAARNLSEFKNTELIKGFVPNVLPQVQTSKIAYLHIDMNSAAPEIAALRYFWDRLVPGAIVLLDDYAFDGYEPQKKAMDELGDEVGFSVASLPTGQGLIVK